MAGGQMLDLEAPGKTLSEADIRNLQRMKTGALITFGCVAGGILGETPEKNVAALRSFGDALGAAFQLADDLLDAEGDAAIVGKATGKDQRGRQRDVGLASGHRGGARQAAGNQGRGAGGADAFPAARRHAGGSNRIRRRPQVLSEK